MKKTIIIATVLCLCHACQTVRYIPIETNNTEYRDNYIRDSIYHQDSIVIRERGDTLILERHRYLYRDKFIRDSIYINDTTRIPYPVEVTKEVSKPLTRWQNFQIWCGRIAIVFLLFALKIRKRKRLF